MQTELHGQCYAGYDLRPEYLRDLFVEPARFRQGIGRALFHEAVKFAQMHGSDMDAV